MIEASAEAHEPPRFQVKVALTEDTRRPVIEVPLRNILPGAPPPGAWIDQALVLWVIVALVTSMVVYVGYWWRQVK